MNFNFKRDYRTVLYCRVLLVEYVQLNKKAKRIQTQSSPANFTAVDIAGTCTVLYSTVLYCTERTTYNITSHLEFQIEHSKV